MNTQMTPTHGQPPTLTAANMTDLQVGDLAAFDPIYGLEKVGQVDTYTLAADAPDGLVSRTHRWPVLRFEVIGAYGPRFVIRFPHEPVMRIASDG